MSQDDLIPVWRVEPLASPTDSGKHSDAAARGPVALRPFRDPVVVILLLAGTFDWLSGNPIHSVLLFAVGLALGRDAVLGEPGAGGERTLGLHADTRLSPVAVLGAVAYVVVVGGFGRYSWPAPVAGPAAARRSSDRTSEFRVIHSTPDQETSHMNVQKAVIPAAGLGTRFLPATKAQPKEMRSTPA